MKNNLYVGWWQQNESVASLMTATRARSNKKKKGKKKKGKKKKYKKPSWRKGVFTGIYVPCLMCGSVFYVTPSLIGKNKYCSKLCYMHHSGIERIRAIGSIKKYQTEQERKDALLASGRKSYRKNIEKRRFYYRQLAHKRKGAGGSFSKNDWARMKARYNYTCPDCGAKEPDIQLTIDHIIPISRWGQYIRENPETPYQCNDIENIQPLCPSCNRKKHNKLIPAFQTPTCS